MGVYWLSLCTLAGQNVSFIPQPCSLQTQAETAALGMFYFARIWTLQYSELGFEFLDRFALWYGGRRCALRLCVFLIRLRFWRGKTV